MSKVTYEGLNDLLQFTHRLGFIPAVKLTGTAEETQAASILEDKSVVFFGKLRTPISELQGQVVGLSRMNVLDGFMRYPDFTPTKNGTISFKKENHPSHGDVVSEVHFEGKAGTTGSYRFVGRTTIEEQIRVPEFRGVNWDITYVPTKEDYEDLKYLAGIFAAQEAVFIPEIAGDELVFSIGTQASDRTQIHLNTGELTVENTLKGNLSWPLDKVLTILAKGMDAECKMFISSAGALKIEIDTGVGLYEYILTAKPV